MDDIASNVGDVAAATEIDFSLLSGANATFIAEMNKAWRDNPSSVDRHWAAYFEQLGKAADFGVDIEAGPSWGAHKAASLVRLMPMHQSKQWHRHINQGAVSMLPICGQQRWTHCAL